MQGAQKPIESRFVVVLQESELRFEGYVLTGGEAFSNAGLFKKNGYAGKVLECVMQRCDHL
jgi:hypothetical protein